MENLALICAISAACGFLIVQMRSSAATVFGTLAFAFTLASATIFLGVLSLATVAMIAMSILAYNIGMMISVFGALLLPASDDPVR